MEVVDGELRRQAHEWAERTAVEQGLPPKVEDFRALRDICLLLRLTDHTDNALK